MNNFGDDELDIAYGAFRGLESKENVSPVEPGLDVPLMVRDGVEVRVGDKFSYTPRLEHVSPIDTSIPSAEKIFGVAPSIPQFIYAAGNDVEQGRFDLRREAGIRYNTTQGNYAKPPKFVMDQLIAQLPTRAPIYDQIPKSPRFDGLDPLEAYFWGFTPRLTVPVVGRAQQGELGYKGSSECLRDQVRTRVFLDEIRDTVRRLSGRKNEVLVCDAGCGSFPVLGLYAALQSKNVRVLCLEFNEFSAQMAREIVKAFGLEEQMVVVQGDATSYRPKDGVKFDMLLSETMNRGLFDELLVQIVNHLQQFVVPEGVILPSKVNVFTTIFAQRFDACIKGFSSLNQGFYPIYDTSWQHVAEFVPGTPLDTIAFDLPVKPDPKGIVNRFGITPYAVMMNTTVDVGNRHLPMYSSVITCPRFLHPRSDFAVSALEGDMFRVVPGDVLHVSYVPGQPIGDTQIDVTRSTVDEISHLKI